MKTYEWIISDCLASAVKYYKQAAFQGRHGQLGKARDLLERARECDSVAAYYAELTRSR